MGISLRFEDGDFNNRCEKHDMFFLISSGRLENHSKKISRHINVKNVAG
jgi:hypothetical protein